MKKLLIGLSLSLITSLSFAAETKDLSETTCGKVVKTARSTMAHGMPAPSIDFCLKILALEEFGHNHAAVRKSETEQYPSSLEEKAKGNDPSMYHDIELVSKLADRFSSEFRGITVSEATTNPAFLMILERHLNK